MPQIEQTTLRILGEQSYWKVDYPSLAVTDLQAINLESKFLSFHLNQKTNENILYFYPSL